MHSLIAEALWVALASSVKLLSVQHLEAQLMMQTTLEYASGRQYLSIYEWMLLNLHYALPSRIDQRSMREPVENTS